MAKNEQRRRLSAVIQKQCEHGGECCGEHVVWCRCAINRALHWILP